MKRVSDERAEQLREAFLTPMAGSSNDDTAALIAELQAYRAAFRGVKMVVPVEWAFDGVHADLKARGDIPLVSTFIGKNHQQVCEESVGVIRLDELSGDAGELEPPHAHVHEITTTPEQMQEVIKHAREVVAKSTPWRDAGPRKREDTK